MANQNLNYLNQDGGINPFSVGKDANKSIKAVSNRFANEGLSGLHDSAVQGTTKAIENTVNAGSALKNSLSGGLDRLSGMANSAYQSIAHGNQGNLTPANDAAPQSAVAINNPLAAQTQQLPGANRLIELQGQLGQLQQQDKIAQIRGNHQRALLSQDQLPSQQEIIDQGRNRQEWQYAQSLPENGGDGNVAQPNAFQQPSNHRVNQIRSNVQGGEARRKKDYEDNMRMRANSNLMYGDPYANILHGKGSKRAIAANAQKRQSAKAILGNLNSANKNQEQQRRYEQSRVDSSNTAKAEAPAKQLRMQKTQAEINKLNSEANGQQQKPSTYGMNAEGRLFPKSGSIADSAYQNQMLQDKQKSFFDRARKSNSNITDDQLMGAWEQYINSLLKGG